MFPRFLEPKVIKLLTEHPALLLHGPRGAGKSTLLRELARRVEGARLLQLEDPEAAYPVRNDPRRALAGVEPLLIDEITRAPELLAVLAQSVRQDPRPGRFLLAASVLTPELRGATEATEAPPWLAALSLQAFSQGELRGRTETFLERLFEVPPDDAAALGAAFPAPELQPGSPRDDLLEILLRGGFADIHVRHWQPPKRAAWFSAHVTEILRLDLPDLARLPDYTPFPLLLRLLAARVGTLLNTSEIGRASGIPYATLTRYLEALAALHLYAPLPAWHGVEPPRLTRAPRVYLSDAGLAAHLARVTEGTLPTDTSFLGPLLRTLMIQEIRKQADRHPEPLRLTHFRTAIGEEVDLVVERADGEAAGLVLTAAGDVPEPVRRGTSRLRQVRKGRPLRIVRVIPRLPGTDGEPPAGAVWLDALWGTRGG